KFMFTKNLNFNHNFTVKVEAALDLKPIQTEAMVFQGAKVYNGHAAIAKAFKNYVNIDCV
ncbi:hypothetical protein AAVH_23662, partial [Aphelenchoides avenae]